MKIFNPTGWTREIKVDSKEYKLAPFGFMEFSDEYGQIIVSSENYRNLGVVSLDYDDVEKARFRNFEAFKKFKAISGLKKLLEHLNRLKSYEISAYDAMMKEKNNAEKKESVRITANVHRFDPEIELAEKWLSVWEKYTPPNYVESDKFVEKEDSKPVLEFDPAQVGTYRGDNAFNTLPTELKEEVVFEKRGVRKVKNEPVHDSNPGA